jgi:hypothetical protein
VDELSAQHDRIAESLNAVIKDLAKPGSIPDTATWRQALGRFEALYAEHSKSEVAFFHDITTALESDAEATKKLRDLLAEP